MRVNYTFRLATYTRLKRRMDAIRAANEEIVLTRGQPPQDPILGPDPTGKEFGAHTFSSSPGGSDAHSAYWDRNNPSLVNMGLIIKGQQSDVH